VKFATAALNGDRTLAELPEKFDVHSNQIVQWKTQLFQAVSDVFTGPVEK
jgi:hypothetical protein